MKLAQVWLDEGDFLSFGRYFWLVLFHTLIPNMRSSPLIRSDPHKRFDLAISRMSSIVSDDIFGLFCLLFDFNRQ
jgi:hypothetical protein